MELRPLFVKYVVLQEVQLLIKGKRGRSSATTDDAERNCSLQLCSRCYRKMVKGKQLVCTKAEVHWNLLNIIQTSHKVAAVAEYLRAKPRDQADQMKLSNIHELPSRWKPASTSDQNSKPILFTDDLFLITKSAHKATAAKAWVPSTTMLRMTGSIPGQSRTFSWRKFPRLKWACSIFVQVTRYTHAK